MKKKWFSVPNFPNSFDGLHVEGQLQFHGEAYENAMDWWLQKNRDVLVIMSTRTESTWQKH